jgi:O-antigen ligase/tetratricopeptide (TPR) repeat protein
MQSIDGIGPQWFYLSLINGGVLLYLFLTRKEYAFQIKNILSHPISLIFLLFFIWAGFSYFYAINRNEMIVCFARLSTTFLAYINISILVFRNKKYFNLLSTVFMLTLLWESAMAIQNIRAGIEISGIDTAILKASGNAGNKNILAASIAIKIPFCIYFLNLKKGWQNLFSVLVLTVSFFALFLLNTRSTFVSIGLISFSYLLFVIFLSEKTESILNRVRPYLYYASSLLIALVFSILFFKSVELKTDVVSGYKNPLARVAEISVSNAASSGRLHLWESALDYAIKHPVFGAGYGNWKLASIPYEKSIANDYMVPYHAHNDFVENAAELGFAGLFLYASIFLVVFFYAIKGIFYTKASSTNRLILASVIMGLMVYFVDAFFNFPAERTIMQLNFAFAAGLLFIVPEIATKKIHESSSEEISPNKVSGIWNSAYLIGAILLVFTVYINSQVYDSMKGQKIFLADMEKSTSDLPELNYEFPEYPSLAYNAIPIVAIEARYLFKKEAYDTAFKLLDKASIQNPFIFFSDYLKGGIYFKLNKLDSGIKYSKIAFYNKPRSFSAYKNYLYASVIKKDSFELKKSFETYIGYRNEAAAWKEYLMGSYNIKGKADKELLDNIDTAIVKFPDSVAFFTKFKSDIQGSVANQNARYIVSDDQVKMAKEHLANADRLFNQQKYNQALKEYLATAAIDKFNFVHFENAAVCNYINKSYKEAIRLFDKAILISEQKAAKSYYYKGVSSIYLGDKATGCNAIRIANEKGYLGDANFNKTNCN